MLFFAFFTSLSGQVGCRDYVLLQVLLQSILFPFINSIHFCSDNDRPYQREIIIATLERNDVFVQAATSFGKSLCYQLPAVLDHGITICVSPLVALMRNQVQALEAAGVAAACLNGQTPSTERAAILNDLRCGHPRIRLLYVTPEYCQTEKFRKHLTTIYGQNELSRVAIDEAHCISEWGHEFRPSFLQLSYFRETFPRTPIICLTATATPKVRTDVINTLGLNPSKLKLFTTTTSRPNLHYEIQYTSDDNDIRFNHLVTLIKQIYSRRTNDPTRRQELDATSQRPTAVSSIVYASFRAECNDLAARLRAVDIGAAPYHAGLSPEERSACQTKWLANEPGHDVIVATTAFGMGIDKEDVRLVVHWNVPKTFEGYYQEAGRAGRDGKASLCFLYYSREDCARISNRILSDPGQGNRGSGGGGATLAQKARQAETKVKSFRSLVDFCECTSRCRHELVTEYFGEKAEAGVCDFGCDYCKDAKGLKRRKKEGLASEEYVSTQQWTEERWDD